MSKKPGLNWSPAVLPVILRCGIFDMAPDDFGVRYQARTHALHLYLYEGTIRIGDGTFRLRPGDVTISPAGAPSAYRLTEAGRHWCVHFWPAAEGASGAAAIPLHLRLGPRLAYFRERLRQVTVLHNRPVAEEGERALWQAMASAAFLELLLSLAASAGGRTQAPPVRQSDLALAEARRNVEENLSGSLGVPELAEKVGLSHNYLARMFRKQSGMTLKAYLASRRIEEARHLLENTDLPVKAVAARVGYPDPQYFNKRFRRLAGMSPSAFRRTARGGRELGG
jgi:AraC-like DNA-binding protein